MSEHIGSLPEHVEAVLELGLKYNEPADRLLALQAANEHDATHGTYHGQHVLSQMMLQKGKEFKFSQKEEPHFSAVVEDWFTASVTHEVIAAAKQEVGARIVASYMLLGSSNTEKVFAYEQDGSLFSTNDLKCTNPYLASTGIVDHMVGPKKPIVLIRELRDFCSISNLNKAIQSVRG